MRSENEIQDQIEKTLALLELGDSIVPGMTYEEGVNNALRWAIEETEDEPMEA